MPARYSCCQRLMPNFRPFITNPETSESSKYLYTIAHLMFAAHPRGLIFENSLLEEGAIANCSSPRPNASSHVPKRSSDLPNRSRIAQLERRNCLAIVASSCDRML